MTKNIAILGSGRVATGLATKLASVGYQVTIGSRDPIAASARWKGPAVTFKPVGEAANSAAIVINATPGDTALARMTTLQSELMGKILVDVSNATERKPDGAPGGLLYANSSLAELLQEALPETAVIKTLNTMLFPVMSDPSILQIPATAFLSGNDQQAKQRVRELLADLGWPENQLLDLGDISTARGVEALMLLVPSFVRSQGMKPFAITVAT